MEATTTNPTPSASIPYASKSTPPRVPLGERVNMRLIGFIAVVMLVLGYPTYLYLDSIFSGGIHDLGGGWKAVDLKAMSTFAFDQERGTLQDVPEQWRQLDGTKVVLRGEMYAPSAASPEINQFDLVYSIAKCCVTTAPQVQHFVKATTAKPDRSVPFLSGLVEVRGTLHVKVSQAEGKVISVYQLSVDSVEPVM